MEQAQQIIPSSHLQSQLQSETNQSHMLQPHGGVGHGSVDVNDDRKLVKRQRIESHLHSHAHTQQGATPNQLNGFPYYPPASLSRGLRFDKSKLVSLLAEYFPDRSNLGTLVYNPTTTWETLQSERLIGLKPEHVAKLQELKQNYKNKLQDKQFRSDIRYIPVIPPLPVEYSNSLLEIKISRRFIEERRFSTKKVGKIWGGYGGIYTDDSDILTVLQHQGLFNGTIDLSIWNDKWEGVASPPDEGENVNDISVTLLLLPPLESYSGSYCNGVNPGTWSQLTKKNHNGLSFVVYNVKWESPGALARDKNLFKDSLKETLEDMEAFKEEMKGKDGWTFNKVYFEELRSKYKKLDDEKKEVEAAQKEAARLEEIQKKAEIEAKEANDKEAAEKEAKKASENEAEVVVAKEVENAAKQEEKAEVEVAKETLAEEKPDSSKED